jgi:RNA-directed DNA polymerase
MTLYDQLCRRSNLVSSYRLIYNKKSQDKKKRGKDINGLTLFQYHKTYPQRITKLIKKLEGEKYTTGALRGFYRQKREKKSKRLIGIATVDDRIVQKTILQLISPLVTPHLKNGVSFGSISRGKIKESDDDRDPVGIKGAMTNLINAVSLKNFWVFKSDIESFYDRIPKARMHKKLTEIVTDPSMKKILKEIIYSKWGNPEIFTDDHQVDNKVGIAQGPPLSTMLSNIYLIEFDMKMKAKYGLNFSRYADDFIVLCKTEEKANEAKRFAKSILKTEKLNLSPDPSKTLVTSLKKNHLIFLGLKITRHKITFKKTEEEIKLRLEKILNGNESKQDKTLKANQYTRGIFESYKNYHCEKFFKDINSMIRSKRKMNIFSGLKLLDLTKLRPIRPMETWESYFRKE